MEIFHELRRALRADGTLWLNLGDCYSGGGPHHGDKNLGKSGTNKGCAGSTDRLNIPGLKPKDLVGIPWMVAFALRADGWYLRSDIIWNKPNPMPESVTDRPTKAHEYLFLLAKSGESVFWTHRDGRCTRRAPEPDYRWVHKESGIEVEQEPAGDWKVEWRRTNLWRGHDYFYDGEAIKERAVYGDHPRNVRGLHKASDTPGQPPHKGLRPGFRQDQKYSDADSSIRATASARMGRGPEWRKNTPDEGVRSRRSVWTISAKPYPEAHFATFPPDLIKPCIMAGTSERGCCPGCGAQWERQTERSSMEIRRSSRAAQMGEHGRTQSSGTMVKPAESKTTGWYPSCECGRPPIPSVVLDPFIGSGTTGEVCQDLGRAWLGFDLNDEYAPLIEKRTRQQGLF